MPLSPLTGTATTTVKISDYNALVTALNAELATLAARIDALENEPDPVMPPDLTLRVEALESMIQRVPAENPMPMAAGGMPSRPAGIDPDEPTLIYNRAVIYYRDIELYADRIGERTWRLYASLNFIVISPAVWTYDEIFEGTAEEAYEHAMRRLQELAELKPSHDAVHERVKQMSEGQA